MIRQRLLEDTNLDFQTALKKTQMLEQVERQSGSYLVSSHHAAALNSESSSSDRYVQASAIKPTSQKSSIKKSASFAEVIFTPAAKIFAPQRIQPVSNAEKLVTSSCLPKN